MADYRAQIKQLRDGIIKTINDNVTSVIIYRKATKTNAFGETIINPYAAAAATTIRCRISHEGQGPFSLSETPAGDSTGLARYVLTDYTAPLTEGDRFEALGKTWQVGPVDKLIKFGETIGTQSRLLEAQ